MRKRRGFLFFFLPLFPFEPFFVKHSGSFAQNYFITGEIFAISAKFDGFLIYAVESETITGFMFAPAAFTFTRRVGRAASAEEAAGTYWTVFFHTAVQAALEKAEAF